MKPEADFTYLDHLRPSRIRELARGKSFWTSVDLLAIDFEGVDAIRRPLESMGLQVNVFRAGLAQHVINVLSGDLGNAEYLILGAHGDEGSIVLPDLADEVAATQPWNHRLPPEALGSFVALPDRVVIGTGCDMGDPRLAEVFLRGGCKAYIGPLGGPFVYASVVFPILLFYELTELRSLAEAMARIRQWDGEFEMWRLYEKADAIDLSDAPG